MRLQVSRGYSVLVVEIMAESRSSGRGGELTQILMDLGFPDSVRAKCEEQKVSLFQNKHFIFLFKATHTVSRYAMPRHFGHCNRNAASCSRLYYEVAVLELPSLHQYCSKVQLILT